MGAGFERFTEEERKRPVVIGFVDQGEIPGKNIAFSGLEVTDPYGKKCDSPVFNPKCAKTPSSSSSE